MDLTRIKFIKESNLQDLHNNNYLEKLIIKLGFNTEGLREQPKIVKDNGGGLLIWQYPNQFAKYLSLLRQQNINSYIEIGCRWGGTFVLTNEYLKMFNSINKSVAIDIIDSPVVNYCISNNETQFIKINSQSEEFKTYINNNYFDLIFIDGDHSYEGVKRDFDLYKKLLSPRGYIAFHDIDPNHVFLNSYLDGEPKTGKVRNFWQELNYGSKIEIICTKSNGKSYLSYDKSIKQNFGGIGIWKP